MSQNLSYRPDIDGLRAVAVLLVILSHFALVPESINGFIGVDIFFVISGFLITRIIQSELAAGQFSIAGFYKRRALRILPALTVVLAFTSAAAIWLFMPSHLLAFGKSLIAQSGFASNVLFWTEKGYFDASATLKPLLHTWSLAIEEQFYILFPLVLWWVYKKQPTHLHQIVWGIWAVSFILNVVMIALGNNGGTFYLLHARAWELTTGAILALNMLPVLTAKKAVRIGWFGVVLLACGVFLHVSEDQFPGWFALLPVLGAGALIYAGMHAYEDVVRAQSFHKILSHRYMVAVGKISYSLYLWHWPLYVFATYWLLGEPNYAVKLQLLLLCFALSYLSWQYVEQPFRQRGAQWTTKAVLLVSVGVLLAFAVLGSMIVATKGLEFKFSPRFTSLLDAPIGKKYPHAEVPGGKRSGLIGPAPNEPDAYSYAVWGDSHAKAIAPAIELAMNGRAGKPVSGVLIEDNSCFLLQEHLAALPKQDRCIAMAQPQTDWLLANKHIKLVFIAQRWSERLNEWDKPDDINGSPETRALREKTLRQIIKLLQDSGKQVVLIGQVPQIGKHNDDIPSLSVRAELFKRTFAPAPTQEEFLERYKVMYDMLARISQDTDSPLVRPYLALCDDNICHYQQGDKSLYYDDDHLSVHGALLVAPVVEKAIPARQ